VSQNVRIIVSIVLDAGKYVWTYTDQAGNTVNGDVSTPEGETSKVTWARASQQNWQFKALLVDTAAPVSGTKVNPASIQTYVNNAAPPLVGDWKYLLQTSLGVSPDPKIVNPPSLHPLRPGGKPGKPKKVAAKRAKPSRKAGKAKKAK